MLVEQRLPQIAVPLRFRTSQQGLRWQHEAVACIRCELLARQQQRRWRREAIMISMDEAQVAGRPRVVRRPLCGGVVVGAGHPRHVFVIAGWPASHAVTAQPAVLYSYRYSIIAYKNGA